jgi:dTDP-D-glucose 4,6-dehydratase
MPVTVTRASNNYAPYQFPEKLIPRIISNAIKKIPAGLGKPERLMQTVKDRPGHDSALCVSE